MKIAKKLTNKKWILKDKDTFIDPSENKKVVKSTWILTRTGETKTFVHYIDDKAKGINFTTCTPEQINGDKPLELENFIY